MKLTINMLKKIMSVPFNVQLRFLFYFSRKNIDRCMYFFSNCYNTIKLETYGIKFGEGLYICGGIILDIHPGSPVL